MSKKSQLAPHIIERHVHMIRDIKVMLDHDLARLYGVTTKALNQAVTRNVERFPPDSSFRLTIQEYESLRSQIVTGSQKHRDPRIMPRVFTQEGVAMFGQLRGMNTGQRKGSNQLFKARKPCATAIFAE